MRRIELNRGYFALVDDEDFERVNAFNWQPEIVRRDDGTIRDVYASRTARRPGGGFGTQKMHRFILGMSDSKLSVDHIDHDGLNNQKSNLRVATNQQNSFNQRLRPNNKSGFKGVSWDKGMRKWAACIHLAGKKSCLGYFDSASEASLAYRTAATEMYGEFAHIPTGEGR